VSTENWHEERERLVVQLERLKSGQSTHFDRTGQLRYETTDQAVDRITARLAKLDARLGTPSA
jgi:hypothetical protein